MFYLKTFLYYLIKKPKSLILLLGSWGWFNWLQDKPYLKLVYRFETGKRLNIEKPRTYNEKLQWLKLYDRKPEYSQYVDKYAVRSYVSKTIGEEYLIPLIGVYEKVDDIDWKSLPGKFVIKCTHGSGSNIICKDKEKLNIEEAKTRLNKWMKKNWYWFGREWPYKSIEPKIICEEYLKDNITDYKIMCFNGQPRIIQVHRDRQSNHTLDFYDTDWNKTAIRRYKKTSEEIIPRPKCFDEMLSIAKRLSKNEIHVRIDLYEIDERIFFSEKTYYSASGFSLFAKEEYDELLGDWIQLPIDKE